MNVLSGWKTYIAAAGLLGLAVYQASQADYATAFQSLMAALAAFGLRNAVTKVGLAAQGRPVMTREL